MAAIGISLWKYVMRYAPHTPDFFNRDRFVLSNGAFSDRQFRDNADFRQDTRASSSTRSTTLLATRP